jgi:hypothetical protein
VARLHPNLGRLFALFIYPSWDLSFIGLSDEYGPLVRESDFSVELQGLPAANCSTQSAAAFGTAGLSHRFLLLVVFTS